MGTKRALLLVGVLLALSAAGLVPRVPFAAPASDVPPSAAAQAEFLDLAFGKVKELTRWNRPIYIGLGKGTTTEDSVEVAEVGAEVEAITGVPIRIGNVAPNVVIQMVPKEDFGDYVGDFDPRAGGATQIWWRPDDHAVLGALVVIDPTEVDRCAAIRHEIMHLVGLRGHSRDPRSALYITSTNTEFSHFDRVALRLLYSPRLRPGMSRDEVIRALRLRPEAVPLPATAR